MAARSNTAGTKAAKPEQAAVEEVKTEQKPSRPTQVDIHQYIPVKNGFPGVLIYASKRTGEVFRWEKFGDEQDMELQELKSAKSAAKAFFQNNWFLFDDDYAWVTDYLGVGAFYRYALKEEQFDELFEKSPEEIKKTIKKLSDGQKSSLGYRARQMIAEGGIDSNRVIAALEEALGVQLVEK